MAPPTTQRRPIKVCLVILYAYSLFNTSTNFKFGGSEVRAATLAKGLAASSEFDVSVVTFDHGQPLCERIDNVEIRVYSGPPPPVSRWKNYKWLIRNIITRLLFRPRIHIRRRQISALNIRTYEEIDADIYCVFGANNLTAEVASFCHANGKQMILFAGSDLNFSNLYYHESPEIDPYGVVGDLAYFSIKQADKIIAQTHHQKALCNQRFGRDATVMYNPIDTTGHDAESTFKREGGYVLWVGKSDRTKRPDIVLNLAKRLPDVPFIMIMNRSLPTFHHKILCEQLPNVEIIESVPFDEMEKFFRKAAILCSTSRFEGFPNTFLQAGLHGLPILSLDVDPDGFIGRERCGVVVKDGVEELAKSARLLLSSPNEWTECSRNIAAYVRREHQIEDKLTQLRKILLDLS